MSLSPDSRDELCCTSSPSACRTQSNAPNKPPGLALVGPTITIIDPTFSFDTLPPINLRTPLQAAWPGGRRTKSDTSEVSRWAGNVTETNRSRSRSTSHSASASRSSTQTLPPYSEFPTVPKSMPSPSLPRRPHTAPADTTASKASMRVVRNKRQWATPPRQISSSLMGPMSLSSDASSMHSDHKARPRPPTISIPTPLHTGISRFDPSLTAITASPLTYESNDQFTPIHSGNIDSTPSASNTSVSNFSHISKSAHHDFGHSKLPSIPAASASGLGVNSSPSYVIDHLHRRNDSDMSGLCDAHVVAVPSFPSSVAAVKDSEGSRRAPHERRLRSGSDMVVIGSGSPFSPPTAAAFFSSENDTHREVLEEEMRKRSSARIETFARTAFIYGFLFPPLWLIGAILMFLPPSFHYSDDSSLRHIEDLEAYRKEELRWARRCLAAFVLASVVITGGVLLFVGGKYSDPGSRSPSGT